MLQDSILGLWLIFRAGIVIIRGPQIVKVGTQREAKHKSVAAFVAEVNVGPIGDAINSADVKLALLIQLTRKILLIIIAFILQLQTQRLPGCLIFHTAKQRCRAMEHLTTIDRTRLFVAIVAITEFIAVGTQRVADITAGPQVAPAKTQ